MGYSERTVAKWSPSIIIQIERDGTIGVHDQNIEISWEPLARKDGSAYDFSGIIDLHRKKLPQKLDLSGIVNELRARADELSKQIPKGGGRLVRPKITKDGFTFEFEK